MRKQLMSLPCAARWGGVLLFFGFSSVVVAGDNVSDQVRYALVPAVSAEIDSIPPCDPACPGVHAPLRPGDPLTFFFEVTLPRTVSSVRSLAVAINFDARILTFSDCANICRCPTPVDPAELVGEAAGVPEGANADGVRPLPGMPCPRCRVNCNPDDPPGNEVGENGWLYIRLDAGPATDATLPIPTNASTRLFSITFNVRRNAFALPAERNCTAVLMEDIVLSGPDGTPQVLRNEVELEEAKIGVTPRPPDEVENGCVVVISDQVRYSLVPAERAEIGAVAPCDPACLGVHAARRPGDEVVFYLDVTMPPTTDALKSMAVAINFDARILTPTDCSNICPCASAENPAELDKTADTALTHTVSPLPGVPCPRCLVNCDPNDMPGNEEGENGWLYVQLDAGSEPDAALPVATNTRTRLLEIKFRIRRNAFALSAERTCTRVVLEDIGPIVEDGRDTTYTNEVGVDVADTGVVPRQPDEVDDGCVILMGLGEIGFFMRGDATLDCVVDIGDPYRTLEILFLEQPPYFACMDALDSNDDEIPNLADVLHTLNWLFLSGPAPLPPQQWGWDPDWNPELGCELGSYKSPCEGPAGGN